MYCSSCGKQIAENSVFCQYCGRPVAGGVSPIASKWVYRDFIVPFPSDFGRVYTGPGGNTETGARSEVWQRSQQAIRLELQKWLDDGWEPIGEIGPAGITIEYLGGDDYAEPTFFRSKMRIEESRFPTSFVARDQVVTNTGTVKITRTYHLMMGRAATFNVIIDGRKMGILKNGGSISREVMPGTHTIQITASLNTSKVKEFTIASSEQLSFLTDFELIGLSLEQT